MAQESSHQQSSSRPSAWEQSQTHEAEALSATRQGRDAGVDDLLDEIDGLLENNAEQFVKGYVQKGGQ